MQIFFLALLVGLQAPLDSNHAAPSDPLLAWGEWDGDGLPDALLLEPGVAPRLMRNNGDGPFEELGARVGLPTTGGFERALWSDFDGDGREDLLLVAASGGSRLLRNTPSGVFEDCGAASGLPLARPVRGARWLDLNGDGRADLELATDAGHELFHNRGAGVFERLDWLGRGALPTETVAAVSREAEAPVAAREPDGEPPPSAARPGARRQPAAPPAVALDASAPPAPGRLPRNPLAACVYFLQDQATAACLRASSLPTLGLLYPLSTELNVDLAGHVGMGTTNNTHKLTIEGTSGNDVLRLKGTLGSTNYGARLDFGDPGRAYIEEELNNRLRTFGQNRVTLETDPNIGQVHVNTHSTFFNGVRAVLPLLVGIGVSSPAWPLDVSAPQGVGKFESTNATNGSVIELRNSTPGTPNFLGALNFVNNAGQFPGQIAYSGANALTLRTNGAQRVVIDSVGDVGVGVTSPTARLHVKSGGGIALLSENSNAQGDGVYGLATSTATGDAWGVRGESRAVAGQGVHGEATATSGATHGVFGRTASKDGVGVYGVNTATPTSSAFLATGVLGEVGTGEGQGVWGRNSAAPGSGGAPVGVLGTNLGSSNGFGVFSEGRLGATGSKTFVQPHPEDPSKSIQFICLEGNEAGTYCRGRGRLEGGVARIRLPEEFRLVTSTRGLTAQLTTRGPTLARLAVESCTREELVVHGDADVEFDWLVNGLRRAFEDEPIIVPNTMIRPRLAGVPFLPGSSPAYRALLVEAGITNADGTPNEATAARLGWELYERDDPRAERFLPAPLRHEVDPQAVGEVRRPADVPVPGLEVPRLAGSDRE